MNLVKEWLSLEPLDTLFFKGSEPMIAGENHEVRTVFPPMPSTLMGAITTAILRQRQIKPEAFTQEGGPAKEIHRQYPLLGTPGNPGFQITGPLIRFSALAKASDWFLPAPAHWYAAVHGNDQEKAEELSIKVSDSLGDVAVALGLCGSVPDPIYVRQPAPENLKSLAGNWLNAAALQAVREGQARVLFYHHLDRPLHNPLRNKIDRREPNVIPLKAFSSNESRVGIALEPLSRKVRTGHLYASTQVRLHDGVTLIVGLSKKLSPEYLNPQGVLQLGGEQRLVRYEMVPASECRIDPGNSSWIMSLSPIPYKSLAAQGWEASPRASGSLIRLAGWDMQKNFHKPIIAYLPAGTVIKTALDMPAPFGFLRL